MICRTSSQSVSFRKTAFLCLLIIVMGEFPDLVMFVLADRLADNRQTDYFTPCACLESDN